MRSENSVVVCVAHCAIKRYYVLLQAWRLVRSAVPQTVQARLNPGRQCPIQSQLDYMAQALGIADSVEFAGEQKKYSNFRPFETALPHLSVHRQIRRCRLFPVPVPCNQADFE